MANKQTGCWRQVPAPERSTRTAALSLLMAGMTFASVANAAITVSIGEEMSLSGVTMDHACEDMNVDGTLNLANVTITNVRNVIIGAAGVVKATGSRIEVSTAWTATPGGAMNATDTTVHVVSRCGSAATTFTGNTAFNNLSAVVPGHAIEVASGTELSVSGALTLSDVTLRKQGAALAYLTLLPTGTQIIANVGVDGVSAVRGQHLAPTLNNVIAGGAAPNWFRPADNGDGGAGAVTPIPTMGPAGLALMGALVALAAGLGRRLRGKQPSH